MSLRGTHSFGLEPVPGSPYDEAFEVDGSPLAHYAPVLEAIRRAGPAALAAAMTEAARARGLSLGAGIGAHRLPVDPVPRVFTAAEWSTLEAGLIQRARMLEALLVDVYAGGGARVESVLPMQVLTSSVYYEPDLAGADAAACSLGIVGFDVVRRPDGGFALLEDNLLTPGHAATSALRQMQPLEPPIPVDDVHAATIRMLGGMLGEGDSLAILSDEPFERASWELRWLGSTLRVPVLGYDDLRVRGSRLVTRACQRIERLWQRTSEDRLRDDEGGLTRLGELLLEPLRSETVSLVSAIGCGVCDDKRTLRYTPELMRALLGEEPLLAIPATLDLAVPSERKEAAVHADELVFKPRNGAGGRGVSMPPHDRIDARRRRQRRRGAATHRSQPPPDCRRRLPRSPHRRRPPPRGEDFRRMARDPGWGEPLPDPGGDRDRQHVAGGRGEGRLAA